MLYPPLKPQHLTASPPLISSRSLRQKRRPQNVSGNPQHLSWIPQLISGRPRQFPAGRSFPAVLRLVRRSVSTRPRGSETRGYYFSRPFSTTSSTARNALHTGFLQPAGGVGPIHESARRAQALQRTIQTTISSLPNLIGKYGFQGICPGIGPGYFAAACQQGKTLSIIHIYLQHKKCPGAHF